MFKSLILLALLVSTQVPAQEIDKEACFQKKVAKKLELFKTLKINEYLTLTAKLLTAAKTVLESDSPAFRSDITTDDGFEEARIEFEQRVLTHAKLSLNPSPFAWATAYDKDGKQLDSHFVRDLQRIQITDASGLFVKISIGLNFEGETTTAAVSEIQIIRQYPLRILRTALLSSDTTHIDTHNTYSVRAPESIQKISFEIQPPKEKEDKTIFDFNVSFMKNAKFYQSSINQYLNEITPECPPLTKEQIKAITFRTGEIKW